jgi:hypothetical protein
MTAFVTFMDVLEIGERDGSVPRNPGPDPAAR